MSVQALSCALALRDVTPSEKLLLLALANYADERMRCWPSQKRLAADTSLSDRTVRTLLASMEERGLLSREEQVRRDGSRSTDIITLHFAGRIVPAEVISGGEDEISGGAEIISGGVRKQFPGGAEVVSALTTFEPSLNRQFEPSAPIGAPAHAKREPQPGAFEQFWSAYPRKVAKLAAQKAWKRAKLPPIADVLAALDRYVRTKPADIDFCHPATWLNQGRWLDEAASDPSRAPPAPVVAIDPAEQARRIALIQKMSA